MDLFITVAGIASFALVLGMLGLIGELFLDD